MSKHSELARDLFLEGYNCSQSVAAAYADALGIDRETMLRMSASFGAGIGRMRKTCGAVCGMFIIAGMKTGARRRPGRETQQLRHSPRHGRRFPGKKQVHHLHDPTGSSQSGKVRAAFGTDPGIL